jgi:hypothetical protein
MNSGQSAPLRDFFISPPMAAFPPGALSGPSLSSTGGASLTTGAFFTSGVGSVQPQKVTAVSIGNSASKAARRAIRAGAFMAEEGLLDEIMQLVYRSELNGEHNVYQNC